MHQFKRLLKPWLTIMGTKPNTTNDSRTGLNWTTLKMTDVYAS
jgi:hypothetical protein